MSDTAVSGLRRNQNWLLLFAGQAVSLVGFFVLNVTLVLWVGAVLAAGTTWAPAAVGGLLICSAAPALLVGPVAGVYVDRWDRRRTMIVADVVSAGLVASLLLLSTLTDSIPVAVQLGWVYAVVASTSVCAQFFIPSRVGLTVAIVAQQHRSRALSLMQATGNTAAIVGPPLGAPLLFAFGVHWALIINTVGLLFSAAAVRAIRTPAGAGVGSGPHRGGFAAEFRAGLRFFLGTPLLVGLAVSACIATLGAGALNTLHVFFVEDRLGVDARWLGTLVSGYGAGSVLGALLAAWLAARFGEVRFLWSGLLLAGALIMVYSRLTSLPPAIVVILLAGIPIGALNAVLGPLVVRVTPPELIGRVMATFNPLLQGSALAAMALTGLLASTALRGLDLQLGFIQFGPYDSVFVICGLLMVFAGAWAVRVPAGQMRSADPTTPHPG